MKELSYNETSLGSRKLARTTNAELNLERLGWLMDDLFRVPAPAGPPGQLPGPYAARAVERQHPKTGVSPRGRRLPADAARPRRAIGAGAREQKTDTARRDRLREWAAKVEKARGHNKAAVALANKMARLAWAVWRDDATTSPRPSRPKDERTIPTRAATRSSDG